MHVNLVSEKQLDNLIGFCFTFERSSKNWKNKNQRKNSTSINF